MLGVNSQNGRSELFLPEDTDKWADLWVKDNIRNKQFIALCPGGGTTWGSDAKYRRWPIEKYSKLIEKTIQKYDIDVVIFGDQQEVDIAEQISSRVKGYVINMAGKTTLLEFLALLKKAFFVICNDGGPLHMAVAVGARVVSLFGPVDERVYGPFDNKNHIIISTDIECRPCYKKFKLKACDTYKCISNIDEGKVLDAVSIMYEQKKNNILENKKSSLIISVIICTYNRVKLIKRAIDSVLMQKVDVPFEIIIVDDASTDNTEKVIKDINDRRIRYLKQDKNKGYAAALNLALLSAQGEYISILDSDDEYLKGRLQRHMNLLRSLKDDIGMVFSNYCINGNSRNIKVSKKQRSGFVTIDKNFPASVFTQPSNWMFRKKIIEKTGLFDEFLKRNQDTDFFARIVRAFPVYFLNEVLTAMYVHESKEGRDIDDVAIEIRQHLLVKWYSEMKKDKHYLSDFYYCAGKHLVRVREFDQAIPWLLKAIRTNPCRFRSYVKLVKAFFGAKNM